MMAPICSSCAQEVRDVSDQYLRLILEHRHRRPWPDAVYFCARNCKCAWLLVEDELERVDRRSVLDLEG